MNAFFKSISAFLLLLPLITGVMTGQSFNASVSKSTLTEGERFQVTFTLENADGSDFKPPNFKGFNVLMGPSTQQSMNFVNGRMSRSIGYSYVLQAGSAGDYVIGKAAIKANGKTLETKPLQIKVVKGGNRSQSGSGKKESLDSQAQKILRENIMLRLYVSKRNVWWGEHLTATYKVIYNPELSIVSNNLNEIPAFQGFWSQELETGGRPEYEIIDGKRFASVTLKKYVLIPQQSGTLKVDDLQWDFTVRLKVVDPNRRRRSIFDDFFDDPFFGSGNYKDFSYTAKTATQSVHVKALPEGDPVSFNGAVGTLSMEAWIDKKKAVTNDPVTLKVKVSGNGNLKLLNELNIEFPPDFESYEPKVADNLSVGSGGISGNKVFEYLLLPKNPGNYKIKPVEFTYFDLEKEDYVTISSDEFSVEVAKGSGEAGMASVSGVSKENIKYIGKDIRFIKTDASLGRSAGRLYGSPLFIGLNLAPLALFFIFFFYLKNKRKMDADITLLRNRKATKIARKRLSRADSFLKKGEKEKYYEELSRALWGYLGDKLGIPYAELTGDTAKEQMLKRGVSEDTAAAFIEMIDKCEFARFAPGQREGEMENMYGSAAALITKLEGSLK